MKQKKEKHSESEFQSPCCMVKLQSTKPISFTDLTFLNNSDCYSKHSLWHDKLSIQVDASFLLWLYGKYLGNLSSIIRVHFFKEEESCIARESYMAEDLVSIVVQF